MNSFRAIHLIIICLVCRAALLPTLKLCAEEPLTPPLSSPSPEAAKFFESQVRPILAENCFKCHGVDKAKGGLRLDSLSAMLAGGDSGEVIVPGKPEESLMIEAINYESSEMPPDKKLSDDQIKTLTRWVAMGAPWPGSDPSKPIRTGHQFSQDDLKWWAIQPLSSPEIPKVPEPMARWARNPIDRFIASGMQAEGLTPAPEADRTALVRRLYLNVVGLPPSPEQVADFLKDQSPDAYEKLVDRLLNSKGYGEHAARQWLDLVRYADSDGYRADAYRPNAYHYRDYVIRSFNADKPYDRFVQEQIAGDELFPDDNDAQYALGYLRHWVYEWNIRDARTQWKTILEDATDTTADVFLGLGLQCAKCHNHKFDPLLQKDYFQLQAFLAPIMPVDAEVASPVEKAEYQRKLAVWEEKTAEIRGRIAEIEKPYREKYRDIAIDRFPDDLKTIARKPAAERTPLEEQLAYLVQRQVEDEYVRLDTFLSAKDKEAVVNLRRELKKFDHLKPEPLPTAMVVSDVGPIPPETVLPKRPNEPLDPDIPAILKAIDSPMSKPEFTSAQQGGKTTGRRASLAKWLTEPTNVLSTRVIVNRLWQSHFGRGLAANPSDFGRLGGPPSHPELLDWLARELVRSGWSLKAVHRQILLSATFRQSTNHPDFAKFQQIDPANRYYWRRDTLRLSAEQLRDSILQVTGELQDTSGGPGHLADSKHRTIYTRVMRNSPDQLLDSFDLPQFFSSNATRNTTTTPVQSLLLINSDLMLAHARKLAAMVEAKTASKSEQVSLSWSRVYGRQPSPQELAQSLQFLDAQQAVLETNETESPASRMETGKLPYRDGQAIRFDVKQSTLHLSVPHVSAMNVDDFTIETFFQVRSIAETGAVRTLVSKWDGSTKSAGWRFGITGAGSRRKPQTLVLQMVGQKVDGKQGEAAIFSDQFIRLNTPYYASASFRAGRDGKSGSVTFYLKDLSNDDEPLQIAEVKHDLIGGLENQLPLTFGALSGKDSQWFDGLLDDVRWVGRSLPTDEILYTVEKELPNTIGHWQFETVPGVMRDSSREKRNMVGRGSAIVELSPRQAALVDFCHALLNSNEFLYQH